MDLDISQDIFYQVKKEILDKLDIILQKINLQIVSSHPKQQFSFIELAHFEPEISSLFNYLDRLYESLNSSISAYNSSSSIKSNNLHHLHEENQKLILENNILRQEMGELKAKIVNRSELYEKCRMMGERCMQFEKDWKEIRNGLRAYKFSLLQTRVQIISKLKEFQEIGEKENMLKKSVCNQKHGETSRRILQQVNEILDLC